VVRALSGEEASVGEPGAGEPLEPVVVKVEGTVEPAQEGEAVAAAVAQLEGDPELAPPKSPPPPKPGEWHARINAKEVKAVLGPLSSWMGAGLFEIGHGGLRLKALEASHVSLTELNLPAGVWEEFRVVEPEGALAVDMGDLNKFLSRARDEDTVALDFESGVNQLRMQFSGGGISTKTFRLPLSRLELEEAPDLPKVNPEVEVTLTPDAFVEMTRDVGPVSPHMVLGARGGILYYSAREVGGASVEVQFDQGALEMECGADAKSTYTNAYLGDVSKLMKATESLSMVFSTDKPLLVSMILKIGAARTGEGGARGTIRYLLAPRLDPEFA
jgi:DNA polymerase III sliding clamp (beta) subunit (PCNA family)